MHTNDCLIIDDSSVIRNVAERILESHGFRVSHAETGANARNHCSQEVPDAIIVDWDLPNEDSIELIRDLRLCGSDDKRPKIIYLTTEMDVAAMTKAKRAGADGLFMKPFDRSTMEEKFREMGLAA